ncbi:MAG: hypothetical protein A3I11_07775 [Elusimicrobia bacterium RIFCSPLOWO2_02_FULL_39_32]|nr:MAG: hypothetical protein A3B80_00925 [Elusimicrobia bacterium RIFCSPHIGHO2_02_FULL_39_36]OGR92084.1 MAG: hypothetical protein A3I11_07775 [Elusimicrobia bacterium RIFCSPLOWO2_02_FULL_39_32]OGR98627.1 MAG: hypothetical protein A3G85_04655 [Elusimicrobia bacterium RIFCSPLOWO2_12_FULL_39_28]
MKLFIFVTKNLQKVEDKRAKFFYIVSYGLDYFFQSVRFNIWIKPDFCIRKWNSTKNIGHLSSRFSFSNAKVGLKIKAFI